MTTLTKACRSITKRAGSLIFFFFPFLPFLDCSFGGIYGTALGHWRFLGFFKLLSAHAWGFWTADYG